jgi:polyketide biosynthesis acyl carrier protein
MMSDRQQQVFAVVKAKVMEVLPDLDPVRITLEQNLTELGANSVDRVEIAMMAMDELGVSVPRVAMAHVADLRGLVEVLIRGRELEA